MTANHHEADLTIAMDESAGVIRLKAVASFGDPVELTADDARELAAQLLQLADELE
jgi:hypothetical protein